MTGLITDSFHSTIILWLTLYQGLTVHQLFLRMVFSLVLQIFLYLEAFEYNTTSDCLNHMVLPIRRCIRFKVINLGQKGNEHS